VLLAAVGRLLGDISRSGAIACRYGGEEFTVILPEADSEAAVARAEAIRLAIADLAVEADGKPLSRVTASIGVAALPGSVENLDELLEAADKALYLAKSNGRNRIVVSPAA
jgi:diguanylate cyclase (GGDEF)-like protein